MPSKKTAVTLSNGQIWKLSDRHIQIVHVGKLLAQYKEMRTLNQRGAATQFKQIGELEKALARSKAKLMKNAPKPGAPVPPKAPASKKAPKARAKATTTARSKKR